LPTTRHDARFRRRSLLIGLSVAKQRAVLYQVLGRAPGGRLKVFDEQFLEDLGYERVVELAHGGPIEGGADLDEASAVAFICDVFKQASPAACSYVLDRVATVLSPPVLLPARVACAARCAEGEAEGPELRDLQRSLITSALLPGGNAETDPSLACVLPGDMSGLIATLPWDSVVDRAAQLGALLAWYPTHGASRGSLDTAANRAARTEDVVSALTHAPAESRADVLAGFLEVPVPIPAPGLWTSLVW